MARTPDKPAAVRLARSVDEFSGATGIGRTKLWSEIAAGRLMARKVGARTLILDEDGRAYLTSLPTCGEAA